MKMKIGHKKRISKVGRNSYFCQLKEEKKLEAYKKAKILKKYSKICEVLL